MTTLVELDKDLPEVKPITRVKQAYGQVGSRRVTQSNNWGTSTPLTGAVREIQELGNLYQECASYASRNKHYDQAQSDYKLAALMTRVAHSKHPRTMLTEALERAQYELEELEEALAIYDEAKDKEEQDKKD